MTSFVIAYNRRTGEREVTEFSGEGSQAEAMRLRVKLEAERDDRDVEVVSLVSDSLETVQKTHSRYFREPLHA